MSSSEACSNQYPSSNSPFNTTTSFFSNDSNQISSGNGAKVKCTRSKSQPVFNKDNYTNSTNANTNSNSNYGSIPTSESQKNSLYGCSSFKIASNNSSLLSSSSSSQNKNLTSSPICNFDAISENESNTNKSQAINHENPQNDSSNPESSFYEDQLDNELESFSDSTGCLTVRSAEIAANDSSFNPHFNNLTNKVVKIIPPVNDLTSDLGKSTEFNGTAKLNGMKSVTRAKSGNSNHHVSFNINNAIYTSRQETPIPISILKQPMGQSYNNTNSNNKPILSNGNSNTIEHFNNNNSKDSNVKNGNNNNSEKDRIQNVNKSVRSDSKTTIL